jgi:RNA polymerase sigma factor (sigma-70 family)
MESDVGFDRKFGGSNRKGEKMQRHDEEQFDQADMRNPPWLNSDGTRKTDDELRALSKTWGPSIWEKYLESIEVAPTELLAHYGHSIEETAVEDGVRILFSLSSESMFPHLRAAVNVALSRLTPRQYEMLKLHFYERKSQPEIANILGISRSTVRDGIHAALQRMRTILGSISIKRLSDASKRLSARLETSKETDPPNFRSDPTDRIS